MAENKKRYLCRYAVKTFVIMKGEEKIEMDHSNIIAIEYLNDYEFNIMALLKVSLRVDVRKRIWILKNKKDVRVKFELEKIGMDVDAEAWIIAPEECWNLEFGVQFNDEDEAIDIKVLEERISLNEGATTNTNNIQDENYYESQNILDLYLFHPKLLKASRKTCNRVYTKNILQNFVGQLLTETEHDKIIMSKFENDEIYEELLTPANPAYKNLIYLDQYYGFYEKGALIYYDINALYIINLNGKVTAKRKKEWTETSFLIPTLDTAVPGNGMVRVEGEEKFYPTISEMEINPQKFTIGKNVELGSEAKMVITDGVEIDIYSADQSYIDERNEKIVYVRQDNKYTGTIMKTRMEENECVLYISGDNFDINAFTPNKTFRVIFDDVGKQEKYGKNEYRIAYAYHYIKMESMGYMISSHRIILKKTSGPTPLPKE